MTSDSGRPPTLWYGSVLQPRRSRHPDAVARLAVEVDRQRVSTNGLSDLVLDVEAKAIKWVLEGLYQAYFSQPRSAFALPLSDRFYSATRFSRVPFSFGAIQRIVDAAQSLGWIKLHLGEYDPEGGLVTTIEAAGDLARIFSNQYHEWAALDPPPLESLILIADSSPQKIRRAVERDESPEIALWQLNLQRINALFLSHCICLDAPNDVILEASLALSDRQASPHAANPRPLNFSQVTLRRIFARGRFDLGGRFYGGWWQNVPSAYRKYVAIDGNLTCEADFSGMALNCLYALEGKDPGHEDPYDIGLSYCGTDDPRRKIVKRYVNALLNDEKGTYRLPVAEQRTLGVSRSDLRERVFARHKQVKNHFGTGIGLKLQYLDSQIAEQVLSSFADQGEICLPIHDSFIVKASLIDHLVQTMKEQFFARFGRKINVIPDEVFLGERIAIPEPTHIPQGLTPSEQADALHAIHWGRVSIARHYLTSWVMSTKTPEEINSEYVKAIEIWEKIRPTIAEHTKNVQFP